MFKQIGMISLVTVTVLLTGCQSFNKGLGEVNKDLSSLTASNGTSSIKKGKAIGNKWKVSNSQALSWLSHNQTTWSDDGRLSHVNWYEFWSMQVHYSTPLATKAYQYCHKSSWQTSTPGDNCKVFFEAYSMTNAEESQSIGSKLGS